MSGGLKYFVNEPKAVDHLLFLVYNDCSKTETILFCYVPTWTVTCCSYRTWPFFQTPTRDTSHLFCHISCNKCGSKAIKQIFILCYSNFEVSVDLPKIVFINYMRSSYIYLKSILIVLLAYDAYAYTCWYTKHK